MATLNSNQLIRATLPALFAAAAQYGVPKDQCANFVRGYYAAQPKQLQFHAKYHHLPKLIEKYHIKKELYVLQEIRLFVLNL